MRARVDVGETLIEVLFTIVIISLTFTALFTSLATTGKAGNVQRISAQADVVMRNYAEAAKAAAQDCVAGVPYAVVYPTTLPSGFAIEPLPAGVLCPEVNSTKLLQLAVTGPLGTRQTMQIKVRTP